jgi:hypothetical protein
MAEGSTAQLPASASPGIGVRLTAHYLTHSLNSEARMTRQNNPEELHCF